MYYTFTSNGKTQLILKPEKESEYALLKEMLSQGPLIVEMIKDNINILDQNVTDGLIIRGGGKPDTE